MSWVFSSLSFLWELSTLHPGLVLVLVGVAGEGVELSFELLFEKFHKRHERKFKALDWVFWAVVVIGLGMEMSDAAHSDNEVIALKQQIVQIDPLNNPVFDASGHLEIHLKRDKKIESTPFDAVRGVFGDALGVQANTRLSSTKTYGKNTLNFINLFTTNVNRTIRGNITLPANVVTKIDSTVLSPDDSWLDYVFEFPDTSDARLELGCTMPTVKEVLQDFNLLDIRENCIPPNSEIVGGSARIVVNGIPITFNIPPQKIQSADNGGFSDVKASRSEPH